MLSSHKSFVFGALILMIALILFNVIYIGRFTSFQRIDPYNLAVIDVAAFVDEREDRIRVFDKNSPTARTIIDMAYGPYAPYIMNNDIQISVPNEGEYSLPYVRVGGKEFMIRESPSLRYDLWAQTPPNLVLLGSSMLFQNFNRARFHEKFPDKRMIDFCIGDNIPALTMFLLEKLDDCNLRFEPGTVVIYGMNTFELLQGYTGQTWPYVVEALNDVDDRSVKKRFKEWLRRSLKTQGPKFLVTQEIRKYKRRNVVYLLPVSQELSQDPVELRSQLLGRFPYIDTDFPYPVDRTKVVQLINIIQAVKESGGTFITILLPSSSVDIGRHGHLVRSLDHILYQVSKKTGTEYFNLWNHKVLGIDDTDFILRGDRQLKLNPQHLNYEGTLKFTDLLIEHMIEPNLE